MPTLLLVSQQVLKTPPQGSPHSGAGAQGRQAGLHKLNNTGRPHLEPGETPRPERGQGLSAQGPGELGGRQSNL